MNLNKLNCVVTGASSGIGREVALSLAAKGCFVVGVARDRAKLDSLIQEAKNLKGVIHAVVYDLKDFENYDKLSDLIQSEINEIDLLVNNAALGCFLEFHNQSIEDIRKVLDTTLIAPLLLTSICQPFMRNEDSATVFVSSLAGKMGFPNLSVYSAAKHGIEGFADTLAQELEFKGQVFLFRPGVTETSFFKSSGMELFEEKARNSSQMKSPRQVAHEMIYALENDKKEFTVGSDRFLILILPYISRQFRFTVLKYLNRVRRLFK